MELVLGLRMPENFDKFIVIDEFIENFNKNFNKSLYNYKKNTIFISISDIVNLDFELINLNELSILMNENIFTGINFGKLKFGEFFVHLNHFIADEILKFDENDNKLKEFQIPDNIAFEVFLFNEKNI